MQAWAERFYKSRRWRDTRDAYAQSVGHLCERCLANGLYEPGEIVHHKIHLTSQNIDDPNVALSWENLKLVCRKCHEEEHKEDSGMRYAFSENGELICISPH